ncbi:MAG TPA: hypothetical protein VNZ58_08035 [Thermomicrobiales bacterium]|nr:hypothetical protein [Thermomicrobiales bacterium]
MFISLANSRRFPVQRSMIAFWRALLVLLVVLTGAAPGAARAMQEETGGTPSANPVGTSPAEPCFDGLLRIRDLERADETLFQGMADAERQARAWQSDARLYRLRLGCPLLESGYQWNGTFFSETAQAFYRTDTGEIQAAEDDPESIPTLDLSVLSFRQVYRSLLRAGFNGDLTITASGGVTVRESTDAQPFGPQNAPRNTIYVHLAIEDRNEIKDIWVDVATGTVYRYEM